MAKFYDVENCIRKADQHWEMAGLARQDNDMKDSERQTKLARLWQDRAAAGGWEFVPEKEPA